MPVHNGTGVLRKVMLCPSTYYELVPVDDSRGRRSSEVTKSTTKRLRLSTTSSRTSCAMQG